MAILTSQSDSVRADSTPPTWQRQMKDAIRNVHELRQALGLDAISGAIQGEIGRVQALPDELPIEQANERDAIQLATDQFPVFVPQPYLSRIEPGNPRDPLLMQVLPVAQESADVPGFVVDPLAEMTAQVQPGLLHKYQGRVLLVTTGACAVHCRYCFRRHFPYEVAPSSPAQWASQLAMIRDDDSIEEVLLSGGDPLTLVDASLKTLINSLEAIPHLKRLRIHTRLPVVIPERVTEQLATMLKASRLKTVIVVHTNHAHEIDDAVKQAFAQLRATGAMLFNQSVLLRGVNDDAAALIALSQRLVECDVVPYYLHQLDRVAGAAHFFVPIETGKQIVTAMRAQLPGYAVPRYVQEIAGEPNKVALA